MQHRQDRVQQFMRFSQEVLEPFRRYLVPVIELKKATSKEAVCLVFEKVNTGGVPLSVFELVTATYAADGFNLRQDWFGQGDVKGRIHTFARRPLLRDTAPTDFLQGISLLYTYDRQQQDLKAAKTGKDVTAVSAKREHILDMPLSAYNKWADPLTKGFLQADDFLRHLGFQNPKFLPYRAQIVPLACVLVHLDDRWLEPQIQDRLSRWYWSGVFGELYGSATETRIGLDCQQLIAWAQDATAPVPSTIASAGFQPSRLETLRTRTSAAYRGLYVLLQQQGAKDFFWKARMLDIDRDERGIDIHHIFPRKWCEDRKISPRIYNSIINKTAISLKANRKIGGNAPSLYLRQIQEAASVKLDDAGMNAILETHLIRPDLLRADDFKEFFAARKDALVRLIENAMGKPAIITTSPLPEDIVADDDEGDDPGEVAGESDVFLTEAGTDDGARAKDGQHRDWTEETFKRDVQNRLSESEATAALDLFDFCKGLPNSETSYGHGERATASFKFPPKFSRSLLTILSDGRLWLNYTWKSSTEEERVIREKLFAPLRGQAILNLNDHDSEKGTDLSADQWTPVVEPIKNAIQTALAASTPAHAQDSVNL